MNIKNLNVDGENVVIGDEIIINKEISSLLADLEKIKNNTDDKNIKKYIDDAIYAKKSKNESKLKVALKWIGNNAMDLVKSVATSATIALINNSLK